MTQQEMNDLANRLDEVQAPHNNGRGISHLRGVCFYLRKGDFEGALASASIDRDKLGSLEEVDDWLGDNFPGYESYRQASRRWGERIGRI